MESRSNIGFVYKLTVVAAIGGLLFGYDTAVIAGAIGFLQIKYDLSAAMMGWAASSALIGCVIGAMFAGVLSDRIGRKKVLILSAVLFAVSAIGTALPPNLSWFVIFRIVGGVGVGIASILAPMYISEIAPAGIRGRLVSIYQLGIVSGILLIYFVNAGIAGLYNEAWNVAYGWRWMFGSELLPAALFLILLLFVPESPRWLAQNGREQEALLILNKISGPEQAKSELLEMKQPVLADSDSFSELLKPGLRTVLAIGIFL